MAQSPKEDGAARVIGAAEVMKLVREADAAGFARRAGFDTAPDRAFRKRDPLAGAQRLVSPSDPVGPRAGTDKPPTGTPTAGTPNTGDGMPARPDAPAAPDPAALQARYDEGHAEGFEQGYSAGSEEGRISSWNAGHDTGRREAEAELQAARDAFLQAAAALTRDDAIDLGALVPALTDAIRQLASQRAGQAIDDMPGPFLDRIETLAHQARQGLETVSIRLNPEDHAAIAPHLPSAPLVAKSRLTADPDLGRGDVALRVGSIRLNDVIAPVPRTEADT
ncbi:FliH/SctL family protein [Meridianimarinicoccus sp. RP-17]